MPFGTTNADDGTRSGSGSRSYGKPNESVVTFLIAEIQDNNGNAVEYPTFADNDDAVELTDDVSEQIEEAYGVSLPESVEALTVESLFGSDWSAYDYVGYAPDDEEVGKVNANAHTDLNTSINGYFAEKVTEAFGEKARVRLGISPKKWRDDVAERGKFTRVMVSQTDHQQEQRIKEQAEVGELSESEKESQLAELESEE